MQQNCRKREFIFNFLKRSRYTHFYKIFIKESDPGLMSKPINMYFWWISDFNILYIECSLWVAASEINVLTSNYWLTTGYLSSTFTTGSFLLQKWHHLFSIIQKKHLKIPLVHFPIVHCPCCLCLITREVIQKTLVPINLLKTLEFPL